MTDQDWFKEHVERAKEWWKERGKNFRYLEPDEVEKLALLPQRASLRPEEEGSNFQWLKVELNFENEWLDVNNTTLTDDITTGMSWGFNGSFQLPNYKNTYGARIEGNVIYLIQTLSDG